MVSPQTLRQVVILSGLVLSGVSDGFIFGQMSGMVTALSSKDSEIPLSSDDISWIAATMNITCVGGFAMATLIADLLGPRRAISILSLSIIGVWIMLYFAHNMTILIISRVIVGCCFGGVLFLCIILTGEYTAPNVRAFWLNIVTSGGTSIGTMLGHVLSLFFHWRTVALLGIIPSALSALLACFWVESPPWLASKGRFEECERSFRALHYRKEGSETELRLLIEVEKSKFGKSNDELMSIMKKWKSAISQRYFWKLAILTTMTGVYRAVASKILFSTLAITMLQEISGRSDILSYTILVDGFAVLGTFLSCLFISKMKLRTLFFSTAMIANVVLFALSVCIYFKSNNHYMSIVNCALLALYFIIVNSGPYPVLDALYGEIYPLEIKGLCTIVFGAVTGLLHFVTVKFAPRMFIIIGYDGVFFSFAVILSLCVIYFWVYLPETKGKTLAEIELYFKNIKIDKRATSKKAEHIQSLI